VGEEGLIVVVKQGRGARPLLLGFGWTRVVIPVFLTALILFYEVVWKGRIVAPGSTIARTIDVGLLFVVGPAMAWWGIGVARVFMQRLAKSEAAIEEKSRLLEQRNHQLQTVLQASRAMTAVLDLQQVADLVVTQVTSHTRFTRAALLLGPDSRGAYDLAGSRNLPAPYLKGFVESLSGPSRSASPVEWCRVTRQPVVVENLTKDFRTAGLRDLFATCELGGMIAVPLFFRDQFRGSLTVYLETGGPISTAEISLVSALASQAAVSLENAHLFTQTIHNRARLDRALAFLQEVAEALASTQVGIVPLLQLVAKATARLFAPASVRLRIDRSGRPAPILVAEAEGITTEEGALALTLPVTLDGESFGHFDLFLKEGRSELDHDDMQILRAFVHLTASALGNATTVAEMRQAVIEGESAYMDTLEALSKVLEIRDHETEGHSRRVVQYTLSLAQKLCVLEHEMVPLIRGALMHDIGKIGIPDAILKKQGPLTESEWAIMKQHPLIGYQMLRGVAFLNKAAPIIRHHHERFNGTGYPTGLAGEDIPLGARIFAVADTYDAITSDRPYRKGRSHDEAIAEIAAGCGTQFDPVVVDALLSLPAEELARIRGRNLELTL
jgi:putative nucleotidyltransferase with HDIG domain